MQKLSSGSNAMVTDIPCPSADFGTDEPGAGENEKDAKPKQGQKPPQEPKAKGKSKAKKEKPPATRLGI